MIEQNMVQQNLPTEGPVRGHTSHTFDDDYEPSRPAMRSTAENDQPNYEPSAYENSDETGESYDDMGVAQSR